MVETMPKSKVVPQFKVGDVVNLRRIPQEVHHIPRWSKYEVMSADGAKLRRGNGWYRLAAMASGAQDSFDAERLASRQRRGCRPD